jgi:hypothetical protein
MILPTKHHRVDFVATTKGWDLTDAAEPGVTPRLVNITGLWDTLRQDAKPGWLPRSPHDPVLKNAFDQAWPIR